MGLYGLFQDFFLECVLNLMQVWLKIYLWMVWDLFRVGLRFVEGLGSIEAYFKNQVRVGLRLIYIGLDEHLFGSI